MATKNLEFLMKMGKKQPEEVISEIYFSHFLSDQPILYIAPIEI